jgi:mRNA-degrading endonuclease RelE of RelBE toxin-antitoxin system
MFELWEDECVVAVYKEVLIELKRLRKEDKKGFKKVLERIEMLAKRCFFNSPEQWKPLKGETCQKFGIWELKPKPYRLAFFEDSYENRKCFVIYKIWRKEGKRKDRKLIEKICSEAQAIKEKWEYFKGQGGKNA